MSYTYESNPSKYCRKLGIFKEKQDKIAIETYRKQEKPKGEYFWALDLLIKANAKDKDENSKEVTVTKDNIIRVETTFQYHSKLSLLL